MRNGFGGISGWNPQVMRDGGKSLVLVAFFGGLPSQVARNPKVTCGKSLVLVAFLAGYLPRFEVT
jgi:hypothetical protein